MGTRADFYVGKGKTAEWQGSIAWDGHPERINSAILQAKTAKAFKARVHTFVSKRDDGTLPHQGWPWPWENSRVTDYSYWFIAGKVWASYFGGPFFDPLLPEPDFDGSVGDLECPNFDSSRYARAGSERSGVMVFTIGRRS